MTQHIIEWLPAYHDGELNQARHSQVEVHLQTCPDCRAELAALENLAGMLKSIPVPPMAPAGRFTAQVQLRLPRSPAPAPRRSAQAQPRWILGTALALIGVWAFLQAAIFVAAVFLNAEWFFNLPGLDFSTGIIPSGLTGSLLGMAGSLLLINFGLLVFTTIFWGLWLAFWLAWKKDQQLKPVSNPV